MGVGMAAQLAKRLGLASRTTDSNLNGGASAAAAAAIGQFQFYVRANAQNAAHVYQLPSNAEVGSEYTIVNVGAATGALVYPPANGVINNITATGTAIAIATGKSAFLVCITASTFDSILSA
jgi:hypothetical protein